MRPGQAFRALAQQSRGGAAQYQKPRSGARAIDQHAKYSKKVRLAMNFIDHHQALQVFERKHRLGQSCQIVRVFQIEIGDRLFAFGHVGPGQGGFANLPGADNPHNRVPRQKLVQGFELVLPSDHLNHLENSTRSVEISR